MGVKSRRRWSHAVIHIFMFLSGLEYAIVFPTLWEYLQRLGVATSQTWWLGLTISAITVTDILSGLIVGRIVDLKKSVRSIVLTVNLFQMAGALIYLLAGSAWLLLVSRLVSGCGRSAAVAFLAEICRSTQTEERTPVLLLFNIATQVGLLLGPSANLFLQSVVFDVGPVHVDKLNSPGLLMAGLWTGFSVLVALAYTDLSQLVSEEVLTDQLAQGGYHRVSETLEHLNTDQNEEEDDEDLGEIYYDEDQEDNFEAELEITLPEICYTPVNADTAFNVHRMDDNVADAAGLAADVSDYPAASQSDIKAAVEEFMNASLPSSSSGDLHMTSPGSNCKSKEVSRFREKVEEIRYDMRYVQGSSPCYRSRHRQMQQPLYSPSAIGGDEHCTTQQKPRPANRKMNLPAVVELAQALSRDISSRSSAATSYGSMETVGSSGGGGESTSRWEYNGDPVNLMRRDQRKSDVFIKEAERLMMGDSLTSYNTTSDTSRLTPSISESSEPTPPGWPIYKAALFRREIFVLVLTRLIAFFCQTSLEAIVPPIMNTYFMFDDMANSYLYLVAGLQLMIMFGLLSVLTRCVSDRQLVLAGMLVMLAALTWHAATFPLFKIGDQSKVVYFGVGCFLVLIGIPTVADIGLALYSKLLPEEVQGFGHGLRRFLTQLAVMVGPLWGATSLPISPLLLTIPPLVLQALATVLYCWSYNRLDTRPRQRDEDTNENTPLLS